MNRNKWLLFGSSVGVLALLIIAALQENVFREWRQIQSQAYTTEGPLPVQLRQVVNTSLGVADRCVSCHVAMAPGEQGVAGPGMAVHRPVVHDPAEFGCTVCHGGQGRATDKADAHGRVLFWPAPMLPTAMTEAGCGTCHATSGVPEIETFKRARLTFERLDCVACHRVDGRGGTLRPDEGGMEGPDLSHAGLAGYDTSWYEAHVKTAAETTRGPWQSAFGPVSAADREMLDLFLKTRVGAPRLVEAKSVFHSSGCLGCHKVSGVGGDQGPELTLAGEKDPGRADFSSVPGERTLANWFAEHVRAPAAVVVGSLMPAPPVSAAEVDALTLYTLSLRRRDLPGSHMPRDRMRVERFGEREFTSDGATLFGAFCSGCHGREGQGHRAPGLAAFPSVANPDFLAIAPDALVSETIVRGRPGTRMRAWVDGSTGLTAADVPVIVSHLRTLAGVEPPVDPRPREWVRGDRAEGERLFAAACAGCHGAKGEGADAPALANPVLQQFATDTYLVETITRGRRGTAMAGFSVPDPARRTLSPREIESIVTFIRTWGVTP
ncbi:MAG TPA: c-type cytochrome [Vicinamibacterales bacterium]|nr:c-type cytochrome [Vicinamibacterales bacterium]